MGRVEQQEGGGAEGWEDKWLAGDERGCGHERDREEAVEQREGTQDERRVVALLEGSQLEAAHQPAYDVRHVAADRVAWRLVHLRSGRSDGAPAATPAPMAPEQDPRPT